MVNNPLNMVDPLGLEYWWLGDCLFYDQYYRVESEAGETEGKDTFFIGCFGGGGGGGGGSADSGGGGGNGQTQTKQFTNPCPPVPQTPPNVDVNRNMLIAEGLNPITSFRPMVTEDTGNPLGYLLAFFNLVRTGGEWDYKQQGKAYMNFGNFNYGATGTAAGYSADTLLRMGGWAAGRGPDSALSIFQGTATASPPYGDSVRDQAFIQLGVTYANNDCHQ